MEKARLIEAGASYVAPFDERTLPELSATPTTLEVLRRALLASGPVEEAYFAWAAAVARIDQAASYPNSNVSVGLEQMFSGGGVKGFNQTAIGVGPDSMEMPLFPSKVRQAGKMTTSEAQAAGRRFVAVKLQAQQTILAAWYDYLGTAQMRRIQTDRVALLAMAREAIVARVQSGNADTSSQADLLNAEATWTLATNDLATLEAQLARQRALLNGLLARSPDATLATPNDLPPPRPLPVDDAALLVAAARNNPELQALAKDVAGRNDALELARMQHLPDIGPSFGLTGGTLGTIGIDITLPTNVVRIEGAIAEARASLRGTEAALRQKRQDVAAALVAALIVVRDSERQSALFRNTYIPLLKQRVDSVQRNYAAGSATYLDLIDAQRMVLDARLALVDAQVTREKGLAAVETLAGLDVETLATPSFTEPVVVHE